MERVQLRWTGHRLSGAAVLTVTAGTALAADDVVAHARSHAREHLRTLDELVIEHREAPAAARTTHPGP